MAAFMSQRAPFLLRAGFKQQYKKLPDSAVRLFKGPDAEVVQTPWVNELFVPTIAELPSHARRVAELLGGDPPVNGVPGVEQIGLYVIFEEALRFATLSGP